MWEQANPLNQGEKGNSTLSGGTARPPPMFAKNEPNNSTTHWVRQLDIRPPPPFLQRMEGNQLVCTNEQAGYGGSGHMGGFPWRHFPDNI